MVRAETSLLRDAGHEVAVYEVENPQNPLPALLSLLRAPWNLSSARTVDAAARKHRFDVAHVHNTWFTLSPSVLRALRQCGLPVVVTLHNYRLVCVNAMLYRNNGPCEDCIGRLPWPGVWHRCYNDSFLASSMAAATIAANRAHQAWNRDIDAAIALTEFARSRLIQGGVPEDKIVVKPHHVADPGPRQHPPSASSIVLYVGRLVEGKGLTVLVDAWSKAALPGLQLLIVGDGPMRASVERSAGPNVRLLPWQGADEVRSLMLRSRALVFPSQWYETFGLSAVEALAAGLPVLASDTGAAAEVVSGGGSPLIPPGDAHHWATALGALLDDELVDNLGTSSRIRYEQLFTPSRSLDRLLAVYRLAIQRFGDSVS